MAISKVAVIGAGAMGAGIAAHVANAGVPVVLLDIVPDGAANRNAIAEELHQTFEAHNFVICSFCPRALDFHPEAIPVPYNHSNLDSDEVLYYVEGNYKARKGIDRRALLGDLHDRLLCRCLCDL